MSSNKIVLTSSDGETYEIDEAVARQFQIVSHMIEEGCADKPIRLENVPGKILALAIEYCKKHVHDNDSTDEAKKELMTWDAEFMKKNDQETIFELIHAANFLNAKDLFDFTCQYVADSLKGKTPEEIRDILKIESDFTPEEEAELHKEFEWGFKESKIV